MPPRVPLDAPPVAAPEAFAPAGEPVTRPGVLPAVAAVPGPGTAPGPGAAARTVPAAAVAPPRAVEPARTPGLARVAALRAMVRRYPRQYWLMVAGILISNAGGSLVWPYLLIFASGRLGLPLAAVGSLITIQAVAGMAASFAAGTVADRLGRKVVMVSSLAASGCVYLLLLGAHGYAHFAVLMALFGMANPLYQVGADAMLADMIPSERRAEAYAINRIASNTGFGLGPAIGGFLAATSYSLAFYGASIGFLAYAVLVALFARETLAVRVARPRGGPGASDQAGAATTPVPSARTAASLRGVGATRGYRVLLADRHYLAFAALLATGLIAPSTVWVLLAVYTKTNFGLPEYLYGWIPTVNAVMCVVVQYPVTRLTSRFRPLRVIAVGMAVYAVGAGSVALMSSFPGFVLSMAVLTLGELAVVPTASKYVADLAPADLRGRYMSVYWLGWAASRAIAPLVGGFLNDNVAPVAIWYGALAIGLASSAGLVALRRAQDGRARTAAT